MITMKLTVLSQNYLKYIYIYIWAAQLMFCIYGFQKKNRAAQNDGFIGEYCGEYFL